MNAPDLIIREAQSKDLEAIVRLVNDGGPKGQPREQLPETLPGCYHQAFQKIAQDSRGRLMVAELDGVVVGTFHLVFLTYLAGKGREDAQLEAVHVSRDYRDRGIGTAMMKWVIEEAVKHGCRRVQLTTDKARQDAHRFYERLGFRPSHEGMKLPL